MNPLLTLTRLAPASLLSVRSGGAGRSRVAVAVLASVFAGVALRAHEYTLNRPFWYDESYLLLNVKDVSFAGLCGALDYNLVIPALFLWVERLCYLAFGMTEWAMRLPAFGAGLAALLVMVPLARRVVGRSLWWLPVAFLALSRHAITHGAEVRPYTVDLLVSTLILWTTAVVLAEGRARGWAPAALVALAALGPWFSFPAAFGLAGAVGALFIAAYRHGGRTRWALFGTVALVTASSAVALWAIQARHLYYPGMHDHWGPFGWGGFPNYARPWSVLMWPLTRSVETGNYGTREMGLALTGLALLGAIVLVRRRPALAAAVVLPFGSALAASLLGKYPLANRTTTFLLPALWLSAAVGVSGLAAYFPGRRLALVIPLALLGSDLANDVKDAIRPTSVGTRTAFAHVREARVSGDAVWVSHVEVYQTYYGQEENVYGAVDAPARVVGAARTGRVWVVNYPSPLTTPLDALLATLGTAGFQETDRQTYRGVVVSLYTRKSG
jgi:hypothetical protein